MSRSWLPWTCMIGITGSVVAAAATGSCCDGLGGLFMVVGGFWLAGREHKPKVMTSSLTWGGVGCTWQYVVLRAFPCAPYTGYKSGGVPLRVGWVVDPVSGGAEAATFDAHWPSGLWREFDAVSMSANLMLFMLLGAGLEMVLTRVPCHPSRQHFRLAGWLAGIVLGAALWLAFAMGFRVRL